jgi:hypothetical protein
MSYDTYETSVQDGAPIELYTFVRGATVWSYTSSEVAYVDDSVDPAVTYACLSIDHDAIETSAEELRNNLELDVPRTMPLVEVFQVIAPTQVVTVYLRELHRGSGEIVPRWKGRVISCDINGGTATLSCEPLSTSLKRGSLPDLIQVPCNRVLFDARCGLDPDLWDHATTITAISGSALTVGSLGALDSSTDLPYAGGEVIWTDDDGNPVSRFIESVSGLVLTLNRPLYDAAVSDAVVLLPGCDHSYATCRDIYGNLDNHGGRPHLSTKNPMSGQAVF